MQYVQVKKVLEIGSTAWKGWLENNSILPSSLTCIYISEAELQTGIDSAVSTTNCPDFILMAVHDLQHEDGTFDFVYEDEILHHLNMVPALDEIFRVLKLNGKKLFVEPLDINPVGKLVKSLTKKGENCRRITTEVVQYY
jgi:ubiquinone/menaquinone biosynthesis C-methylase UbiE